MIQFTQRVERSELVVGDHIYFWCTAYVYSHHGIYAAENIVIHYRKNGEGSNGSLPSTCSNCLDCGFQHPGSGVVLSCLDHFLGDQTGSLHRYQYGVSRINFHLKLWGGTCTIARSDPPQDVIYRAVYLLENGFGNYSLCSNNCEDFALYCKTGRLIPDRGRSGQITSWRALFSAFGASDEETALNSILKYSLKRYYRDIGVRGDAQTMPVENLASFRNRIEGRN